MDYLLKMVNSPEDLRKIPVRKLPMLCHEIREKIISAVSDNGGHLASNLGVVELTVALHRVFDVPNDAIVWDVGHQSYAHKILTGRKDDISGLRTKDGISGYPKRSESKYDAFDVGHASTSISAALGIAQSKRLHCLLYTSPLSFMLPICAHAYCILPARLIVNYLMHSWKKPV